MGFATEVTEEEVLLGFEVVQHLVHGRMVVARIGNGLRAVKMVQRDGVVLYAICDELMIMLYEHAHSIFDLRRRFDLGDRKTLHAANAAAAVLFCVTRFSLSGMSLFEVVEASEPRSLREHVERTIDEGKRISTEIAATIRGRGHVILRLTSAILDETRTSPGTCGTILDDVTWTKAEHANLQHLLRVHDALASPPDESVALDAIAQSCVPFSATRASSNCKRMMGQRSSACARKWRHTPTSCAIASMVTIATYFGVSNVTCHRNTDPCLRARVSAVRHNERSGGAHPRSARFARTRAWCTCDHLRCLKPDLHSEARRDCDVRRRPRSIGPVEPAPSLTITMHQAPRFSGYMRRRPRHRSPSLH